MSDVGPVIQGGLTAANWIAIAAITVPTFLGFVYWLTHMALLLGKISQRIDTYTLDTEALKKRVDGHDKLEPRIVKVETILRNA